MVDLIWMTYISLESVVITSLYYQLQTTADSGRIYGSSLNFWKILPTSQQCLKFLTKNTKSCEFYVSTMSPPPVFEIVSEFIKLYSFIPSQKSAVMVNWLVNVTINDISVIYVTAHRCAGELKKLDLRSGSQRHRHFVGFFHVPVQAPTRGQPFYTVISRNRPI